MRKRVLKAAGSIFLLAILLAFPYGPLFPWSPVKPGYTSIAFARADVFYPKGDSLDPAYRQIDDLVAEAERFHRLKAPKRLAVVACRDWSDFHRFMPTIRSRGVGAVTLQTGDVIYVTPKLAEMKFDTREFLLHELSHAVIHQNASLLRSARMGKHGWFMEGIAVACGMQQSYDSRELFLKKAKQADLTKVIGPTLDGLPQPPDMRFFYPAWRYFLEHLIETGGRDRFQQLLSGFIESPDDVRVVFERVYGQPLDQAVRDFQASLLF